jgi:hypothetical protein
MIRAATITKKPTPEDTARSNLCIPRMLMSAVSLAAGFQNPGYPSLLDLVEDRLTGHVWRSLADLQNGHVPYLTYSSHFTGDLHCSILFDPAVCVVWPFPTYTRERESSLNPSIFEHRLHKSALHDIPGCGVSLCTAQASWCSSGCNSTRL